MRQGCDGHFKQTTEDNKFVFCVHKAEFYTYIKFYGLIFNLIPFLCLFVIGSEWCGEGVVLASPALTLTHELTNS